MNKLMKTPLWQMTGEEFLELFQLGYKKTEVPLSPENAGKKYKYGIPGIAETFNCSIPTANRIKASGKIDAAIKQCGRKIVVDSELALELASRKNGSRK